MILRLKERYKYDNANLNHDLKTHLISFDNIEYFEIDLLKEVLELENNEQFMKIWKEEGSKEHCKYKYCLSSHFIPSLELPGMYRINDYENARYSIKGQMPHKMIFIRITSNYLLLDKRRWDIEMFNDVNVLIERL